MKESSRAAKLKNDLLEGLCVRKDEVERDLNIAFGRMTTRLKSLGLMCANVVPAEFKPVVKNSVDEQVRIMMKELGEVLK